MNTKVLVGTPLDRVDGVAKVTGQARKAPLMIGAALLGLVAGLFIRRVQRKQR